MNFDEIERIFNPKLILYQVKLNYINNESLYTTVVQHTFIDVCFYFFIFFILFRMCVIGLLSIIFHK